MAVLRWSQASRAWRPVEGEAPEALGDDRVGIYETLLTSASPYAIRLHGDRIARSWERLTGRRLAAEPVPALPEARAEAIRQRWPAVRFEVRLPASGQAIAQIRRREKLHARPPVRLLPVELPASASAYPHKSVDRSHLARALERAIAAGADDVLFVAGGEVRETAQAFVALVTRDGLLLPPLRDDVLPSTTRTAVAEWCRERGRAVVERPIGTAELDGGTLIYGNALLGLVPACALGHVGAPLPDWFDAAAIERRLSE